MSSEDPDHPIENALQAGSENGFRAAQPGIQKIRLTFDRPQWIRTIWLEFEEETVSRSQESALFVTSTVGIRQEIIRQQWTFSPSGSKHEMENYAVDLQNVVTFDLVIDPGRDDQGSFATLKSLRLG